MFRTLLNGVGIFEVLELMRLFRYDSCSVTGGWTLIEELYDEKSLSWPEGKISGVLCNSSRCKLIVRHSLRCWVTDRRGTVHGT